MGRTRILEQVVKNRNRIVFIFLLMVIGWNLMTIADDDEPGYLDYIQLYSQIFETIQSRYLEETDPLILAEGAIDGILLTNSHYASLEPLSGKSGLIPSMGPAAAGLVLGYKVPMIRVIDVIPGSPADEAGITPGDSIIRINDKVTPFLTVDRAQRMLTGNPDETVELVVQNHLTFSLDEIEIILREIPVDSARIEIQSDTHTLIISVRGIIDEITVAEIRKVVTETPDITGVILDLRHVNRGSEFIGIQLADLFIEDGRDISALCDSDNKVMNPFQSADSVNFAGFQMAVILDETSAGPAETCALALKTAGRATLTGDRSFGKAVLTTAVPLDTEYMMNMVTGQYCSPDGIPVETGLVPDIPVVLPVMGDTDPYLDTARSILNTRSSSESELKG